MTTCFLLPDPVQSTFFIPGGNTPGNGVQVGFFLAGSSTPTTVYKDPAAAVAWSNPIVLDSGGNLPLGGEVWVPSGTTVKVTWAPANDVFPPVSPYRTMDNLSGINDVSSSSTDWVTGPTPTFVSATSFTLAGDQRLNFNLGRRIKSTNTGGTVYSTVTSVTFGAVTTVNVVNDSGSLDAGLSAVFYGIIDPAFSSIYFYHVAKDGGTVTTAANGTTDIWGVRGIQVHITGTNAIFSFSTAANAGATRLVIADSAFPINTSSIMSIPGGQNVTTAVGDRFQVSASSNAAAVIYLYQINLSSQLAFINKASNTVLAGPISGSPAVPTFRTLSGRESAMTLLVTKTGAVTSQISFTTADVDFTAFDEYEFHLINVQPDTNANSLATRFSHDNGVTWASSAIYENAATGADQVSTTALNGAVTNLYALTGLNSPFGQASGTSNALYGANGTMTLYAPNTTASFKFTKSDLTYPNANVRATRIVTAGIYVSTSAISGVQFIYSSGNVQNGTIRLYGIRKT